MIEEKTINVKENKYLHAGKMEYVSTIDKKRTIPELLVYDLISNEEMFECVKQAVDNDNYRVDVSINTGNAMTSANYIINVADLLVLWAQFDRLSEEEIKRYRYVMERSDLKCLKNKYHNQTFSVSIENQKYEFNCSDLIDVFFANEMKFIGNIVYDKIKGYDKRIFFTALSRFFKQEHIFQRYGLDRIYVRRNIQLKNQEIVDYESLDIFDVKNNLGRKITLNESVKKDILSKMNPNYSDIEKCLYIYIKMCMMFSYDYKYLADAQNSETAPIHMNPNRIEKIKGSEDLIVCYEFIYMYAKFLEELGIDYVIDSRGYGKHATLKFTTDKYIVFSDAVSSVFNGDLINAKFRFSLNGITCINKSKTTLESFNSILKKVYASVLAERMDAIVDTEDAVDIYKRIKQQQELYFHLSIKDRVNILFNQIQYVNSKTVEQLGYLLKLRCVLFSEEELDKKVNILVMADKNNPVVIVSKSDTDYNRDIKDIQYYYFVVGKSKRVKRITSSKLLNLIDRKEIHYIPGSVNRIPGIGEGRI